MNSSLLDLVRKLNMLNDDNLADRVIANNDVQWCLSELQDILEEMPILTPPNEWVSVEDRLPEDDTSEYKAQIAVLVLTDRESIKIKKRTYHPGRVYYGKFYPERWDWGTFNDDRITHWMPLPAPPDRRPTEGDA